MLSKLVIAFLPRSKCLLISWLQSPSAVILELPQKSISLFPLFPYLFATKWYWCFWTVVLKKTLECPLDCKKTQPVHPKGDQSWVFIGRTDIEAETSILWPPDAEGWLIWKDPDAGKGWGQEEKGATEDEMVGWHHWYNGHGFWVDSGSWWGTGRPGVLQFTGLQRIGHDWATELNRDRLLQFINLCVCAQLYLTLCSSVDCSLPGSSVHGIFQGSILEWVATSFSMGSSPPRDLTQVSCISTQVDSFTTAPPGKPH